MARASISCFSAAKVPRACTARSRRLSAWACDQRFRLEALASASWAQAVGFRARQVGQQLKPAEVQVHGFLSCELARFW